MADPRIVSAMSKYRAALANAEQASATRLVNAYTRIFGRLQTDIRALEADIAELGADASKSKVQQLKRFRALMSQTVDEMNKYAVLLENEVAALRQVAAQQATQNARPLIQAALPNLPPTARDALLSSFNKLNPEAIESVVGALTDGPLAELLQTFGEQAALDLGNTILEGVALGYNPRKVAAKMVLQLGLNLTRALTMARTEMLRAYRTASFANYAANADVVKGWRWNATKDSVCCLACLALDGKEFSLEQTYMPAHPNCRCAPEPITVSYKDLGLDVDDLPMRQTARQWFDKLPTSQQQKFFSKAGWRAYQDGAVTLDDFIGTQKSKDWGDAYVERSLKEILGSRAKQYLN